MPSPTDPFHFEFLLDSNEGSDPRLGIRTDQRRRGDGASWSNIFQITRRSFDMRQPVGGALCVDFILRAQTIGTVE